MEQEHIKRRSFGKRLLRAFLSILITVVILLSAAFAYLYTNQEQLRGALVSQVNEYLEAEVAVGAINMDFFSRFPDVSFRFNEVYCKEVLPATSKDTLFYFEAVYFEFNLWQLIQSEYVLKGISFDKGTAKIKLYANGTDNFHFWKESPDTTESSLSLNLEDVRFTDTRIFFSDEQADINTNLYAESLDLVGNVDGKSFSSSLKWRGNIKNFNADDIDWLPNREIYAQIDFKTTGDSTFIENGIVEIDQMRLMASGGIFPDAQQWKFQGDDLLLDKFITLVPAQFLPDKSLVDANGTFDLWLSLNLQGKEVLIAADTRMDAGTINLKRSGLSLKNLQFDGHFDNGTRGRLQDAILRIEHIKGNTRTGSINANVSIRNFQSPTVATDGSIAMDFQEALTLAETDFWEVADGRIEGDFNIRKRYTNFSDIQKSGLEGAYLKGGMKLSNGRLKVKDTGLDMENIQTSITLEGADVKLSNFTFTSGSSDFNASGDIKNAVVFGQTPMPKFDLNLRADHLNLDDILAWQLNHRQEETSTSEPFRFDFNVNLAVTTFKHRSFTAQNVTGRFYSQGRDIVGTNLQFGASGGKVNANFRWKPEGNVTELSTNGNMRGVDINRMFKEFDNFGQTSLVAENIYGNADVTFDVSLYFDENTSPVLSSLKSETDFTIRQGRLVNYAPLEALSSFADISELKDVNFATLENHLSISNQNIHIPGMTVKSSVLELWVQGDHGFNDDIDYSLKLKMLDALGRRRRTNSELQGFIEETNREQPLIPVRIYGTLDNPSITLDRSLLSEGIEEEWRSQGQELRDLIDGKEDPTESEPEYIFEWNDTRDTTKR